MKLINDREDQEATFSSDQVQLSRIHSNPVTVTFYHRYL